MSLLPSAFQSPHKTVSFANLDEKVLVISYKPAQPITPAIAALGTGFKAPSLLRGGLAISAGKSGLLKSI